MMNQQLVMKSNIFQGKSVDREFLVYVQFVWSTMKKEMNNGNQFHSLENVLILS